jgi:enoyl-CoA hydratase
MNAPTPVATSADASVHVRREGRAGRLTLNRPGALNALNFEMVRTLAAALRAWINDPSIELVILDGAGGRALCAGGDVVDLTGQRTDPARPWRQFWREEYQLNALIHRYPKPFVALMDGIVMGGGIGLSSHARYRIVTEKSMLAMPETGIGLIPDVGGTWLLGHAQGELGTYLGLTGARMNGSDAIQCGFAGDYAVSAALPALVTRLCDASAGDCAEVIEALADQSPIPASPLAALRPEVDRHFAFDTIEAILDSLNTSPGEFAQKTHAELKRKSPKALKLTLAAIRGAKTMPNLEAALNAEYRLVNRLYEDGEFPEGVRALLIDKDKAPKWNPAALAELTDTMAQSYFSPFLPSEELALVAPNS